MQAENWMFSEIVASLFVSVRRNCISIQALLRLTKRLFSTYSTAMREVKNHEIRSLKFTFNCSRLTKIFGSSRLTKAKVKANQRPAYCDPRGGESPVRPAEPQTDVVGPQRPRWLMRVRKGWCWSTRPLISRKKSLITIQVSRYRKHVNFICQCIGC